MSKTNILCTVLVFLLATICTQAAKLPYKMEEAEKLFEDFIQKFGKQYKTDDEKVERFENFKKNLIEINEKNTNEDDNAEYGINKFADFNDAEISRLFGGSTNVSMELGSVCTPKSLSKPSMIATPEEFDWRTKGAVTKVKDQNPCGSCWAFSAVANIESQSLIKQKGHALFSEQQIVDCDTNDDGCNGGLAASALAYVLDNGLMTEEDYPYEAAEGSCRAKPDKYALKLTACYTHQLEDEEEMKQLLVKKGPLSISACGNSWQNYARGILTNCCTNVNHAVLLVGYGTENNVPYWIIKNSWGNWGEDGYIRIKRGSNTCNILMRPATTVDIA